ncbi:hypothetical protein ACFSM5_15780 [Lacibacterium aquatile]|uniref:Putative tail fiber protein gp53-like C-terminal domain-containing protein n=1 Tax=Lacibacterium aquatile TaxID=1168082 RepID=A0ABW5DTZ4_9PROT
MDLIRHADTALAMPAPTAGIPASGTVDDKPGWFVDCDLESGILGTPIMAQWANGIQAEIVNTITKAGLTPNYGAWDQLGLAVEKLVSTGPLATTTIAGRARLATADEARTPAFNDAVLTPATLGEAFKSLNQNLGANGYQRLPGGLILQWGTYNHDLQQGQHFSYPIAFPTAVRSIILNDGANAVATAVRVIAATPVDLANFSVFTWRPYTGAAELAGIFNMIAIGY